MAGPKQSNLPHAHPLLSADGTDGDKVGHPLVVSTLRRARHFTRVSQMFADNRQPLTSVLSLEGNLPS